MIFPLATLLFGALSEMPTLAVIPLLSGPGPGAGLASARAIADVAIDAAQGRAISASAAPEVLIGEVRSCGADEKCIAERLSLAEMSLGMLIVVDRSTEPASIAVRLVDVYHGRVAAELSGPRAENEPTIEAAVRARATKLLEQRGYRKLLGDTRVLPPAVQEEPTIFDSPWFWIALGAVIAAGATAAVISTRGGTEQCVCVGPPDQCPPC